MPLSPKDFRKSLEQHLLSVVWRHWTALGAATHVPAENRHPVDLEAVLCATVITRACDRRLDKLAAEWLVTNHGLVSGSRLVRMWRTYEAVAGTLNVVLLSPARRSALDELLIRHGLDVGKGASDATPAARPRAGTGSGTTASTRRSVTPPGHLPANAQLVLRELFGVNARVEVLLYLLSGASGSSAGIARTVGYDQKSVYRILESWVQAGICLKPRSAAGAGYALARTPEWEKLLGIDKTVRWVDWPSALVPLLLLLRGSSTSPRENDEYLLSSLMRDLQDRLVSTCRLWGLSFPDVRSTPGAAFFEPAAQAVLDLAGAMAGDASWQ